VAVCVYGQIYTNFVLLSSVELSLCICSVELSLCLWLQELYFFLLWKVAVCCCGRRWLFVCKNSGVAFFSLCSRVAGTHACRMQHLGYACMCVS